MELKNIESDSKLEEKEKLAELPRWKNKKKLIKKIEEMKKREKIHQVLLAEELKQYLGDGYQKEEQIEFQKRMKRYFLLEELEYILKCQEKNSQDTDLYFLVNEYSREMKEILQYFASQYKVIHILSKNQKYYIRWIERMGEDEQTNLVYSRNYRKSLLKAKLIINMDFTNPDLTKFKVNQNAIILNLPEEKPELDQVFNGLFVTGCYLDADKQKLGIYSDLKHFSFEEIYTARMDQNLSFEEVWRKIKKDNVKVRYLKGINGKIEEKEYKCLLES